MIFNRNHHQAQNWLAALALRESKKRPVQEIVPSQTFVPQVNLVKPQVVFTRYDLGHNESEAQKIRELYNELENVSLLPIFALS